MPPDLFGPPKVCAGCARPFFKCPCTVDWPSLEPQYVRQWWRFYAPEL